MASAQQDRGPILDIIERQARRSGIPRDDFLRFAYIETGGRFNPDAHNKTSGAKGLFQFMPGTAAEFRLAGREFDPVANTEAAAALYARNRNQIVSRQAETGHAFISGNDSPNGLDMYLAHQQGGGGYASIQSAIATGRFSRNDTRQNIMGNISADDFQAINGQPFSALRGMNDRELGTAFSQYWNAKYAAIEIRDRGITASAPQPGRERQAALADGVLQNGERGNDVRELQESLNALGFRDARGAELETRSGIYGARTAEAVRGFQQANGLEQTGRADERTREAIVAQQGKPEAERNAAPQATERSNGNLSWPTPGNEQINRADKQGEGRGEFGTGRSGGRTHKGLDIQGDVGDPVVAIAGGTVVVKPNNGAAGHTVHVRHDDGSLSKYFHLNGFNVRDGARVEAGDQIGTMGRTGNTPSRGDTHLHFELWRNGRPVDPLPALRGAERDGGDRAAGQAGATGMLESGARGARVTELQQQLNRLGFGGDKPLAADGIYGSLTREAVMDLQRANHLKADGIVGPQTSAKLTELQRAQGQAQSTRDEVGETRASGNAGFVERMLGAVRGGDVAALQKIVNDQASTLKAQMQAERQAQTQPAPAAPEPAKPGPEQQR